MNLLVLFGVQGSGKGTQAKLLAEKFNYQIFETGAELRKIAKEESSLGIEIKETINAGNLVSSNHIKRLIESFIEKNKDQKIIFDGFPRNQEQLKTFQEIIEKSQLEFKAIIFELSKEKSIERLLKRAQIENREDDTQDIIEKRISIFYNDTLPVIEKIKENYEVIEIDADQSIENIHEELIKKI
ncbi:hypothetical protein CL656_03710 [bacterium]|nr:hypothetical protein [bacterium]